MELQMEQVVDAILQDYSQQRQIDKLEALRNPDKDAVIDMIEKLRRIVFPGYFRDKNFRSYASRNQLSVLIEDTMHCMVKQIALVYESMGQAAETAREQAAVVSVKFFKAIPQVRALVQTDLEAAYAGDPAATGMAEIIFAYPGLYAITVYRLAHVLEGLHVPILPRIMTEHAHSVTGIDIHPGAVVGAYFFIDHGTGIVVGQTTVIGDYVKIYQGVTLGGLSTRGGQSLRGQKRHPTIGDRVTIYANATVLGGDTVIGNDCVIGANSFIIQSVPPCTRVSLKNQEVQLQRRSDGCCE